MFSLGNIAGLAGAFLDGKLSDDGQPVHTDDLLGLQWSDILKHAVYDKLQLYAAVISLNDDPTIDLDGRRRDA